MMALISRILGFRKRKYYFDHFVFATEICSFFILWGFLLLPFLNMMFYSIVGSNLFASDFASGMMIMAVFGIYVAVAARRFFHFKYWYSILYALLISVALIASIEYIYKFILFLITIQFA
jgi:glucose-6-phosphate-specific signal transduction histidine kinase